jgi:hypothetical protein
MMMMWVLTELGKLFKRRLDYYKLKHKQWFGEESSKLLDEWKQGRLEGLQDSSKINGSNLNNKRREANTYFKKKVEGLKTI